MSAKTETSDGLKNVKDVQKSPKKEVQYSDRLSDSPDSLFEDSYVLPMEFAPKTDAKPEVVPTIDPKSDTKTNLKSDVNIDSKSEPKVTQQIPNEEISSTAKNEFEAIANIVFNLGLIVIALTLGLVLISVLNLLCESVFRIRMHLNPHYNWLLFVHSVVTIVWQLTLRWDVYHCSHGERQHINLTFDCNVFTCLMVVEFVFITGFIFVFYPINGLTLWTHILLVLSIARFSFEVLVLCVIRIAARDFDDKRINRLISEVKQRLRQHKSATEELVHKEKSE